jgi:hypothetical protein
MVANRTIFQNFLRLILQETGYFLTVRRLLVVATKYIDPHDVRTLPTLRPWNLRGGHGGKEHIMPTRLYVGSLPYRTTSEQLAELMRAYGDVNDAVVISDRSTGRSKGFGFVEMADGRSAETAISALNGCEFGGRTLVVNIAKERENPGSGRYGSFGGRVRS